MTETDEEAVVAKTARVTEEVVISKDVTERTERVSDTVRRTEVDVENTAGTDRALNRDVTQGGPRRQGGPRSQSRPRPGYLTTGSKTSLMNFPGDAAQRLRGFFRVRIVLALDCFTDRADLHRRRLTCRLPRYGGF